MCKIKGLIILLGTVIVLQLSFSTWALQFDQRPISPIPLNPIPTKVEKKGIALGRQLFNDKHLSSQNRFSCASCHALNRGGSTPTRSGNLKIPSILNSQYNFKQFWNARCDTLEEAIKTHLLDKNTMAFEPSKDMKALNQHKTYKANLTFNEIIQALTLYIKTLNTPHSRFDQYLSGKREALSESEKKGFALFQSYGCITCHQGKLVGGNILQKLGIYNDYFSKKPMLQNFDLGYFDVTHNINDKFVFKVPSLRNVALTAPYFHDSSMKDLESAVDAMGLYQLGHTIPTDDIKLIVQFLNTLTGQAPEK